MKLKLLRITVCILMVCAAGFAAGVWYTKPHRFIVRNPDLRHLTPIRFERRNPLAVPADWIAFDSPGIAVAIPPGWEPVATLSPRLKSEGHGVFRGPGGELALLPRYDSAEPLAAMNRDSGLGPWQSQYDLKIDLYSTSIDQFHWTMSRSSADRLRRMLELRYLMLLNKGLPVVLGESATVRWIVCSAEMLTHIECYEKGTTQAVEAFWKGDAEDALRFCSSVQFK